MNIAKLYKSKCIIILLLLGICLRIGEIDSLFSWGTPDGLMDVFTTSFTCYDSQENDEQEIIHHDTIVQEFNREAIHNSRSFTALKHPKRMYDNGAQKNPFFVCTVNVHLQNLNDVSITLSKEVFEKLTNDLLIVDFIHHKDGKKSDIVCV